MKSSDYAWLALGAGVVGYDVCCNDGETLSERVDDWLTAYPVLTRLIIAAVALHLVNFTSPRFDIIHVSFVAVRRLRVSRC